LLQVVILAGGRGERLNPMTDLTPKPLLPLGTKTVIEYQISRAMYIGATEIIITLSYKADMVIQYLRQKRYKVKTIIEERPLGTAGSLKNIESLLKPVFLVLSGDNYSEQNFKELWSFHSEKEADFSIGLVQVDNPSGYAVVKLDNSGKVLDFKEKPKSKEAFSNLVNCGTYVMRKEIMAHVPKHKNFDISYNLIPRLLANKKKVYGRLLEGYWQDVGTFKKYIQTAYYLMGSHITP